MKFRTVVKKLIDNGYEFLYSKGSHYYFGKPNFPKVCVPCHGSKDISKGVLKSLERRTGLSFLR